MSAIDQSFSPNTACDLRQVKRFAEAADKAAEVASATTSDLLDTVNAFLVELERDPSASPQELLSMAGEARARVSSLVLALDGVISHLGALPIRVEANGAQGEAKPAAAPLPEDPRPKGARDV